MDPALIDRGNLRRLIGPIIRGMILKINLVQNYSDKFGNSQRSLLSPTRGVKSISPNTENWLRERYDANDDNNMSNETKRETNYSMNNK